TQHGTGDTAGEAHSMLARLRRDDDDLGGAATELDAAVIALTRAAETVFAQAATELDGIDRGDDGPGQDADDGGYVQGKRYLGRAAQLALERAMLLGEMGREDDARADYRRAHRLARDVDPD